MRVVSGLYFSPRGGSAHVARALGDQLPAYGWNVTVLSGSLADGPGDADAFYDDLDVRVVDFDAGDAPMHLSYEDRPGAPDACFAVADDAVYEAHVDAWAGALEEAGADEADVLHLHHLTPINEAAARVAPDVPVVGHLHGTELLLLEEIEAGAPAHWTHAPAWVGRMRRWARRCERLLVPTRVQVDRAVRLLGVDPAACIVASNGFDPDVFAPELVDRAAFWRRQLVEEPEGWRPGGEPGSVRYRPQDLAALADGPVLVAVGRFTAVKRLDLLIRAFDRMRRETRLPASLVLVGGHPGEWEGEHPLSTIAATGTRDVFLAGWHDHDALPGFLNAADALVLASVREQFGLVLVEGMACGLPAIAVDRMGPSEIVRHGVTGWLVPPDDEGALAAALAAVVADPVERERRGECAREEAVMRWSWPAIAADVASVLDDVAGVADSNALLAK